MTLSDVVWGIAGTGGIAGRFAQALGRVPGGHLRAVASRTRARADEFASAHDVPCASGSLEELLAEDALGHVTVVESALGFRAPFDATHRIYRPDLGGGVLLDMGVYPLQLAQLVLGPPTAVRATATLGPTGVDHDTVVELTCGTATARLHSSLLTDLADLSRVEGERGVVELLGPVYAPEALSVNGVVTQLPIGGDGMRFEIEEVHRCLAQGRQESSVMSWQDSLLLARTVDAVKQQVGLS